MPEAQIELEKVAKRFGTFTAVEPLDLVIHRGEFVVLLGPSGCGKTTTLRMIAGLEMPSEGMIKVGGREVTRLRPGERDIAFVFQMFALYPHLGVLENIAFPLKAVGMGRAEALAKARAAAGRLGLEGLLGRKPGTLSGGDQQRVSLARAMVREPKAFLMDEPLGTLDADQREATRTELRKIHNELGATTVFVTHDQVEAMALGDRIAVMNAGKLLQFDTPMRVYEHPADLFVADFIGSPGMNFLRCERVAGGWRVVGTEWVVAGPEGGGEMVLGIRPEYVRVGVSDGVGVRVEHTEALGSHNLITMVLGGHVIKARVASGTVLADGAETRVGFDPAGVRWFDRASGRAINAGV